jgi:hypothetical protein
MIQPSFLQSMFEESFMKVKEHTNQIGHAESVHSPIAGVNCVHWIVGHLVVSRCNFSMLLEVPSIWDWSTCKLFIPGSTPTTETPEKIGFATLIADLDRTQSQLMAALEGATTADLEVVKETQTVGEELIEYAVHESFHAGQLELLRRWLGKEDSIN